MSQEFEIAPQGDPKRLSEDWSVDSKDALQWAFDRLGSLRIADGLDRYQIPHDPNTEHQLHWQPGTYGKYMLTNDGILHNWTTSYKDGEPTHSRYKREQGIQGLPQLMGWIGKSGDILVERPYREAAQPIADILQADPRLNYSSEDEWRFGSRHYSEGSAFFTEPHDELNPLFWENDKLKPELRNKIVNAFESTFDRFNEFRDWSSLWIIGSATSYQYDEEENGGDFDAQLVIEVEQFKEANPEYAEADWHNIRGDLHQLTVANIDGQELVDGVTFQLYVRPEESVEAFVQDAAELKQGLYNIDEDRWEIDPVKPSEEVSKLLIWLPEAQALVDKGNSLIDNYNDDPSDENKQACKDFYEQLHEGRAKSFAGEGGQYGQGNFEWQFFVQFGRMHELKEIVGGYLLSKAATWWQDEGWHQDPADSWDKYKGPESTVAQGYEIEQVPTSHMLQYTEFNRKPGEEHQMYPQGYWDALRKHIRENGISEPLVLEFNPDTQMAHLGEGHHRLQIAHEEGLPSVPVRGYRSRRNSETQVPIQLQERPEWKNVFGKQHVPDMVRPSYLGLPTVKQAKTAYEDGIDSYGKWAWIEGQEPQMWQDSEHGEPSESEYNELARGQGLDTQQINDAWEDGSISNYALIPHHQMLINMAKDDPRLESLHGYEPEDWGKQRNVTRHLDESGIKWAIGTHGPPGAGVYLKGPDTTHADISQGLGLDIAERELNPYDMEREWHFGKATRIIDAQYYEPTLDEIAKDDWKSRTPFVYYPKTDTVYVGPPGTHHGAIDVQDANQGEGHEGFIMKNNPPEEIGSEMRPGHPDEVAFFRPEETSKYNHVLDQLSQHFGVPPTYESFNFSKVAADDLSIPSINYVDEDLARGHDGGLPLLWDYNTNTIHVGPQGAYHSDMRNVLGLDRQIPGMEGRMTPGEDEAFWYEPIPEERHRAAERALDVPSTSGPSMDANSKDDRRDWIFEYDKRMRPEHSPITLSKTAALTRSQLLRKQQNFNDVAGPDQSEIVQTFPDGWTINRLQHPHAECYEGEMMGNCVGSAKSLINHVPRDQWYQDEGGVRGSYYHSVRDPDNIPHGTFYYAPNSPDFTHFSDLDLEGRSGSSAAKYAPYVAKFFTDRGGRPPDPEDFAYQYGEDMPEYGSPEHLNEEADKFYAPQLSGFWHPERAGDLQRLPNLKRAVKPMRKAWDRIMNGEDIDQVKQELSDRLHNNYKSEQVGYMLNDLDRDYKRWQSLQPEAVDKDKPTRAELPEFYWMHGAYGPDVYNTVKDVNEQYRTLNWNHPRHWRNVLTDELIKRNDLDPSQAEDIADRWEQAYLYGRGGNITAPKIKVRNEEAIDRLRNIIEQGTLSEEDKKKAFENALQSPEWNSVLHKEVYDPDYDPTKAWSIPKKFVAALGELGLQQREEEHPEEFQDEWWEGFEPWQRGAEGKGLYWPGENRLETWFTGPEGGPHHYEHPDYGEEFDGSTHDLVIDPDGRYGINSGGDEEINERAMDRIDAMDSRLHGIRRSQGDWTFAKLAHEINHQPGYAKGLVMPGGEIHSWNVNAQGNPSHYNYYRELHPIATPSVGAGSPAWDDFLHGIAGSFTITPNTFQVHPGRWDQEAVTEHLNNHLTLPQTTQVEDAWKFGAAPLFDPKKDQRGLPRPVAPLGDEGLKPVPWTQDVAREEPAWGIIHPERQDEANRHSLCLLCGEPVQKGMVFGSIQMGKVLPSYNELDLDYAIDHGPLHDRCGKLTAAHCPEIKAGLASGETVERPYVSQGWPNAPKTVPVERES